MKKNFLNSYQKNALSPKDKTKYETIVAATELGAILAGMAVVYFIKKKGGSLSKQIGFGLGTTALGFGIAYLATKSYSDKLASKTGISSDSEIAMNQESKAELARLREEVLNTVYLQQEKDYVGNYDYYYI
jgi:hypothetical protein